MDRGGFKNLTLYGPYGFFKFVIIWTVWVFKSRTTFLKY